MKGYYVLLIVASAACSAEPFNNAEGLVDQALVRLNSYIASKSLSVLQMPQVVTDGLFTKRVLSHGTLGDFSTIKRIGSATIATNTDGKSVNYVVETNLGLESLSLKYSFLLEFFSGLIKFSGDASVSAKRSSANIEFTVITDQKSGSCGLVVNEAAVTDLGDFQVTISSWGYAKWVLERLFEWIAHYLVPIITININSELHEFFQQYPINRNLTEYICLFFMPKLQTIL